MHMSIGHILLGLLLAIIVWKLLKITLKTIFWLVLIGLLFALIWPFGLAVIGGIGVLIVSFLVSLILLSLLGFFFLDH